MIDRKRSPTTTGRQGTEQKRSRHNDSPAVFPANRASCAASNLKSLPNDRYTVGWICALEVELAASMAMLDEEFAELPRDKNDINTYTLGRMGQHNVLTCLPEGTTGTNAAAIAATNMLRSFPKVGVGLMVGIGGGAPKTPSEDPREDIRLGDVVVSCPSANHGGVLQYDFGKIMSEGQFIQTGSLSKASVVLSNSVSKLRARHRIQESSIPLYISAMLQLNTKVKENFNHPGVERDQLFRADYEHPNGESSCRSCDIEALLPRKPRESQYPIIHYGLIGSANQVMKHGATRENLRKDKNIKCFEMEAAGLMDILPCLVVRGICDYADSHKNKRWQPYAAAVAAACAKEILSATPPAEVPTKSTFSGIAIYDMLQATIDEPNLDQLLNTLSAVEQEHHISAIPHLDCNDPMFHWVFRNIDFRQWGFNGDHSVLCLTSLSEFNLYQLSSYFVDREKKAGHSVVPIFRSAIFQGKLSNDKSNIAAFIHTILQQLIRCSPMEKMVPILQSFFRQTLEKVFINKDHLDWQEEEFSERIFLKYMEIVLEKATMNDYFDTLRRALNFEGQRQLLFVVDGLDIIHSVGELFGCICAFVKHLQQRNSNIKVLLTSRPTAEVTHFFCEFLHIEHDKERKECLRSLQFHNTRYNKISPEHKGSLEWIWKHKEYRSWSVSDTSRLLYIQGKPGSGKSTLTKYFNSHLLQMEPTTHPFIVARFFYSFREGELQRSHHNMLLSIIYDILQQDEAFFYHQCQTEYRAHRPYGPSFTWDYASLKRILRSLQNYLTTKIFYLIIDALDESQETDRRDILCLFLELCSKMKYSVAKVFLASRPLTQLEARRDQSHNFIKLEDETRSDIYNFAHSLLYGLNSTRLLAQATAYIVDNAQGVFLWVKLIGEELITSHEEGHSEEEIYEFLQQLPTELGDFYARMLEKMKENNLSLSHGAKMFRIILCAKRSLTVDELLHAHGIPESFDLDPKYIPSDISFERRIPSSERFIISCGGNFLEIKGEDGNRTVQIMHQTVREFFLDPDGPVASSEFKISTTHAHACIAIICIRYLMICATHTSLSRRLPKTDSWTLAEYHDYAQYLDKRPLAFYALCHVKSHIDSCRQDANVEYAATELMENLTNGSGAFLLEEWASSQLYLSRLSNTQGNTARSFKDEVLRTAIIHGFTTAAEVVLSAGTDLEKKDEYGRTPLSCAAESGHLAMVKLLLKKGAVINAEDYHFQTPLFWAANNGHLAIVELLHARGAVVCAE